MNHIKNINELYLNDDGYGHHRGKKHTHLLSIDIPFNSKTHSSKVLLKNDLVEKELASVYLKHIGDVEDYITLRDRLKLSYDGGCLSRDINSLYSLVRLSFVKSKIKNRTLTCEYCGKSPLSTTSNYIQKLIDYYPTSNKKKFTNQDSSSVDHIIPISKGGDPFDFKNLSLCCFNCNSKKGNNISESSDNRKYIGSTLLDLSDNVDYNLIDIINSKFKKGSNILEISCGNASDSIYLQNQGYKITCTEYNKDYVQNAKLKNLNCIQHDTINSFPFEDKEFDLVYSRLGLHYFSEFYLRNIFSEINRISNNLLITVKISDDVNTGKVIYTKDTWKKIIGENFEMIYMKEKKGLLYDVQSNWIEVFAKSW